MQKAMMWVLSLLILLPYAADSAHAVDFRNRKYADIQKEMKDIATRTPHTAQVVEIGRNDQGTPIVALKTGTGPISNVVVATHHGNEYGSTEVAIALAKSLAERPIPGMTVYVIPVLNISGYNVRSRWEMGQDPNRDYPGPCGSDGPFRLKSTKALADFLARENIVTSATLHTYSPAILYPWGFSADNYSTEYDDVYLDLAHEAAHESGYRVGNSAADLYPADGCYEDYAMVTHGIWSMLFEMGFSHSPNQAAVDDLIRLNVPSLRRYLEKAPRQRAERHQFTGTCVSAKKKLDLRVE